MNLDKTFKSIFNEFCDTRNDDYKSMMPSDIVYSYFLIKFSTVVVVNGEVIVITAKISNDNLINITIHYKQKKNIKDLTYLILWTLLIEGCTPLKEGK